MIMLVCAIVLAICGITVLVMPGDKLVNPNKLKAGQTFDDAVKQMRKTGFLYLGLAVLFFIIG